MDIVKPKTLILYHAECLDGFISAWIARTKLGAANVVMAACTYNDPVPDLTGYENVYILDFSWKPHILLPAIVDVKYVVVLDHHKTAIAHWDGQELPENMRFIHDLDKSGIGLAWDFFNKNDDGVVPRMPKMLELCQHRDLWHKEVPDCMEVGAAIYAMGYVSSNEFDDFTKFERTIRTQAGTLDILVVQGEAILRSMAQLIETINQRCGKDAVVHGKTGRMININYEFASQCGDIFSEKYDFVIMYEDLPAKHQRKFSLRSRKDGMPVDFLAEEFGGGGHEHSAGFYTSIDDPLPL